MAITSSNNLRRGSRGDDVLELQRKLNQLGYGLDEDASYGRATEAAVRDYQSKNSLNIDGVVGTNTWGALTRQQTNPTAPETPAAPPEPTALQKTEASKPGAYQKSDSVLAAEQALADYEKNKPGAYQSSYSDQIQELLDKVMNREKFSYDFNADPLYQQYKDQYMQGGKQAMMDTTAQAAALSGGFGNSYGATAGNLAYQQYLKGLNDVIPDLYSAALNQYQNEGQTMQNNLGILQGLDQTAYGRYQDALADYYNQLNYQYNKTNNMSQEEYNKYLNDLSAWQADRDYEYGKDWNDKQLAYQKEQDALAQSNWEREFELALQASSGSGGGSSGKAGGSGRSSGKKSSGKKKSSSMEDIARQVANTTIQSGIDSIISAENIGKMSWNEAAARIEKLETIKDKLYK